jgi:hypothetical protein
MASTSAPTAEADSCPAGFDVYACSVRYRQRPSALRAKIEPDSAHPKYILTEKGLGYRFAAFEAHRSLPAQGGFGTSDGSPDTVYARSFARQAGVLRAPNAIPMVLYR